MWHSPFKLYLYPDNPDTACSSKEIKSLLESLQFISAEIADGLYATGDNFLSLLTFMGCSPDIEIEPQVDKPFCYIEISASETINFISGNNIKAAPCPKCKTGIESIPESEEKATKCPACDSPIENTKLNWRKSAFLAKNWICIGNIYELEAIPSDELLNKLEKETGVKWKAAYIRE